MAILRYNLLDYDKTAFAIQEKPMTAIRNFFQNLFYGIPAIGVKDVLDILVVAFLI